MFPALEVYAYGNGDILVSTFNAIVMLLGSGMFATAMLVTGLAAALYILVQAVFSANKRFDWHWFIIFVFVVNVMFVPKTNVLVVDQNMQWVSPGPPPVISNVPLGLAVLAHGASVAGFSMTNLFETAFADPAGMSYSQNGLGFSQNMVSTSTQQYFIPSQFKADLDNYIQACVITDILAGTTNAATVAAAPDLWTAIASGSARVTNYGNPPVPTPCAVAYTFLTAARPAAETAGWLGFVNKLFAVQTTTANTINAAVQADLGTTLLNSYNGLGATGYASAQDIIFQSMMIHQMHESVSNFAAASSGTAALLNLGIAQSEIQAKNQWLVLGELAKKYLPMFRGMIEGFIYGLFPVALLLMLTPGGGKMVGMYLMALIWVQSWSPLFAILNHYIVIYAAKAIPGGTGLTMNSYSVFNSGAQDMLGVLGVMGSTIPMVALALVKGGSMGVEAMMSAASSGMSGAANAGGGLATTGNLSYGNASIGNSSYHNASAWQTNIGSSFTQGRSFTDNDNVRTVNSGINVSQGTNSGIQISLTDTLTNTLKQGKSNAESHVATNMAAAGHSMGGAIDKIESLKSDINKGRHNDTGATVTGSASVGTNYDKALSAADDFSNTTGFDKSKAHEAVGRWAAEGGLGSPFQFIKASVVNGGYINDKNSETYKSAFSNLEKATDGVSATEAKREMYDFANSQATRDSEGYSTSKGDAINASLKEAETYSEEARDSYTAMQKFDSELSNVQSGQISTTRNGGGIFNQIAQERYHISPEKLNEMLRSTDPGQSYPVLRNIEEDTKAAMAGQALKEMGFDNDKFKHFLGGERTKLQDAAEGGYVPTANHVSSPSGGSPTSMFTDGQNKIKYESGDMPTRESIDQTSRNFKETVETTRGNISKDIGRGKSGLDTRLENMKMKTGYPIERGERQIPGAEDNLMVKVAEKSKGGAGLGKSLVAEEANHVADLVTHYQPKADYHFGRSHHDNPEALHVGRDEEKKENDKTAEKK